MKKIYFSLIAIAALTSATAQNARPYSIPGEKSAFERKLEFNTGPEFLAGKATAVSLPVQDTNWYVVDKHTYRNTSTNANSFYTYKIAPTYTGNSINSGGALFQQTGNMLVGGAEGIVIRQSTSPSTAVPVAFYLFNAVAGMPSGAALATCTTAIASSTIGNYVGCNFSSTVLVTGDFCIIMKNGSANPLDSIRLFMNNARTATAQITPGPGTEQKYGESFGIIGYGATFPGLWDVTTDLFTLGAGNTGSDFEFCVAPRVTYTFVANHASTTMTTCNTAGVLYPNTSSPNALSRQWNLNVFFASWAPFSNATALASAVQDNAVTWNFGDATTSNTTSPTHFYNPSAAQAPPPTYTAVMNDQLVIKVQKMSDYSPGNTVLDTKSWSLTVTICNVGLTENNISNQVAVYPNPATDKVTVFVNNADQNSQIQVLNALGQVVMTRTNLSDENVLNTESLSKGVYFVRVGSAKNFTTSKLIINK
jgi:hypothetical protein